MEILFLLIPLAVGLMVVAVVFFLWTVKSGQYDDMEGPAYRILMDDDDPLIPGNRKRQAKGDDKGAGKEVAD
ncbi:MAG: cbb3-type cytochrome oxidase assembly protein CcoS [Gammaproteobacteria bacterium]|nr:MAG: cbb3-type cytochrome oxidase assembly protein CcoS [Gammaproteobacteria bacterium]